MTQTPSAGQGFVFLRAIKASDPPPQILQRTSLGAPYASLPSSRTGQDIISASYAGAGDYLLLRPTGAKDAPTCRAFVATMAKSQSGTSAGRAVALRET